MTVACSQCGEEWPRDPALEVPCPTCHARVGVKCRRPSGHPCELHASRDQAAIDAGFLRPCPKGLSAQQAMALQLELF
jgi:DNA-directed RNA polymerase subunit RPC12/RpoP